MAHESARMFMAAACLVAASCSNDAVSVDPTVDSSPSVSELASPNSDVNALDGLWFTSWGGDEQDGVIYQPAVSELLILGNHVELSGFPDANRLTGTLRFDTDTGRIEITEIGDSTAPRILEYEYDLQNETLTLTDANGDSLSLQRRGVAEIPLANVEVEFVASTEINADGELLVTKFNVLQAGPAGSTWFEPQLRSLDTEHATVLLMQDSGLTGITIDEARRLIGESMPVAIAYQPDDSSPQGRSSEQWHLWRNGGSPSPDSDPVHRMLEEILRPGTLVFIVPERGAVP